MITLKTVYIFPLLFLLFIGCAEEVPEAITEQFNTDSATDSNEIELVDSLFDNIEFEFEDDSI